MAVEPVDLRAEPQWLIARVVQVFGAAQAHHGCPYDFDCERLTTNVKPGRLDAQFASANIPPVRPSSPKCVTLWISNPPRGHASSFLFPRK